MKQAVLTLAVLAAFALLGALVPTDSASAAYNGKSTSCPAGVRTCSSYTARGVQGTTYYAVGQSVATTSVAEAFAWVRGTNIYHQGSVLWEEACQINNGTTCTTGYAYLCDTLPPPAGCGPNNYTYWYGTNWSWFKPASVQYALFTATRSGADTSYCWNSMECV